MAAEEKAPAAKVQTEEELWAAVVALQGEVLYTMSGLPFRYQLKRGRSGQYTKELFIDRRQGSKSLAWSSVRLAFEKAQALEGPVLRPKQIGQIRGVSYIYPLLWRFGIIEVPETVAQKLEGPKLL